MTDNRHIETGLGWPPPDATPASPEPREDAAQPPSPASAAAPEAREDAAQPPSPASAAASPGAEDAATQSSAPAGEGDAIERREPPERSEGQEYSEGQQVTPPAPRKPMSAAGAMIGLLLALLGFTMVMQLKTNATDPTLASARQEDLVRILSDLTGQEQRLNQDIASLQESQRQLSSGVEGREAALEEARKRADGLGILAGTLPAQGTGLTIRFGAGAEPIEAASILDAVQELRGAGAEAMQISGDTGGAVRIIASTFFTDAAGGINVDGRMLTGPYTISVIGDPTTMRTALNIPGGVVEEVTGDGGNVLVREPDAVEVSALHAPTTLEYARPLS
jgi:uncharacterized protein YlxW (UPF0749 family)